jgi:hypothetical protein
VAGHANSAGAQPVSVIVSVQNRAWLAAIIGDRNPPLKHVQRTGSSFTQLSQNRVFALVSASGHSRRAAADAGFAGDPQRRQPVGRSSH